MSKKQKYYVVWKGRKTGIFNAWALCEAQIKGYAGAQYKSFDTLQDAMTAFKGSYWDAIQERRPSPKPRVSVTSDPPEGEYYTVDAACTGNPGDLEYRCIHMPSGQEIFAFGPFPDGTNNVGEFLAIVRALKWIKERDIDVPLYSDSTVAIGWVANGRCGTKLTETGRNRELFQRIAQAEAWLRQNDYDTPITKWETSEWGEIPADYGRK